MSTKFKILESVRHTKSGNVYTIIQVPDAVHRLESSNDTFYAYADCANITKQNPARIWYRCTTEMEDGRFECVHAEPSETHSIIYFRDPVYDMITKHYKTVSVDGIVSVDIGSYMISCELCHRAYVAAKRDLICPYCAPETHCTELPVNDCLRNHYGQIDYPQV